MKSEKGSSHLTSIFCKINNDSCGSLLMAGSCNKSSPSLLWIIVIIEQLLIMYVSFFRLMHVVIDYGGDQGFWLISCGSLCLLEEGWVKSLFSRKNNYSCETVHFVRLNIVGSTVNLKLYVQKWTCFT